MHGEVSIIKVTNYRWY